MRTRGISLVFYVISFGIFVSFPLFSIAVVPTGVSCTPDILPEADASQVMGICPYTEGSGRVLHLKWDLKGSYARPSCSISCVRRGLSYDYACDSLNPAAKAPWNWSLSTRDANNFLLPTGERQDLKAKDDVFVRLSGFFSGEEYRVTCQEKDMTGPAAKIKNTIATKVTAVAPCEVGFEGIALNLLSAQPTPITETGGASWSEIQGQDFCYYTNGVCTANPAASGDVRDIKDLMINLQKSSSGDAMHDFYQNRSLFVLKEAFKVGDIVPIIIDGKMYGHSSFAEGTSSKHALIAYDLIEDGDNLTIKIIDPNDPLKADNSLTCTKKDLSPGYASVSCNKFYFGSAFMDNIVLMVIRNTIDSRPIYFRYKERHDAFCLTNTNSNLCKGTARERLLGNWRLSLKNIPDPKIFYGYVDGFCYSWTIIQTSLVYLGDFVGTDYHPNDGKYINKDCDASHHPIAPPKTSSVGVGNWLASISRAFSTLLPF